MKYNVGCGKRNFGKDWMHVDGGKFPHVVSHDIFLTPTPDNSIEMLYASHVIEYFDREEVVQVLKEWHRALQPGGQLLIAVPDFEAMAKMYINKEYEIESFLGPIYGRMEMNDEKIYHRTAYDFKSLCRLLAQCRFKAMMRVDDILQYAEVYDQDDHSRAVLPHMSAEGTSISLNIICTK